MGISARNVRSAMMSSGHDGGVRVAGRSIPVDRHGHHEPGYHTLLDERSSSSSRRDHGSSKAAATATATAMAKRASRTELDDMREMGRESDRRDGSRREVECKGGKNLTDGSVDAARQCLEDSR